MVNPMNIYITQLAEAARNRCVNVGIIEKNQYQLTESLISQIIHFFNVEFKKLNTEEYEKMLNEYLHMHSDDHYQSNSFMCKKCDNSFLIAYKEFELMDILHELGHVFLELDEMKEGEIRSCNDPQGNASELDASKFARVFAMPSELFEKIVINNTHKKICDIENVAKTFGVDYLQVVCHGRESYYWD